MKYKIMVMNTYQFKVAVCCYIMALQIIASYYHHRLLTDNIPLEIKTENEDALPWP